MKQHRSWVHMCRPTLMWSFGALAFLLQYACRVSTGSFLDQVMLEFSVGATWAGLIGSFFYYPYVAMQLFVGRIVDRFPAHYVLIITMLVFFLANQYFSEATSLLDIAISRTIMGAMGAFAFVVTMKLALVWFENKYLGVLAGLTQVSGMLGVVFGNQIVNTLMVDGAWRPVVKLLSMMLGVLVLAMIAIMKDKQYQQEKQENIGIVEGILTVWRNPQSWYNGIFAGLIYLPTAAFGEYWGFKYLTSTNTVINAQQASIAMSVIFIGWAIGGILSGWFSDYLQRRKPLMIAAPLLCLIVFMPVLYWHEMPATSVYICLGLYGIFNSALVVSYAVSGEINASKVSGVSIAFCNMLSILFGTIALPLIGYIMDLYRVDNIYPIAAYENAVSCFPIALMLAFISSLFIKETNCQQVKKG